MALIDSKSLNDWRNIQLQKWKELQPDININPDSMVFMDASVISEGLYLLQQDAITLTNNAFLAYATGDELTNLGLDRGVSRREASSSTGIATFGRASKAIANYTISAGTLVSTQPSGADGSVVTYRTLSDVTLYGIVSVPGVIVAEALATGGTISNGVYNYRITAVSGDGKETSVSAYTTVTIANGLSTNSISLTWASVPLAVSYNVYISNGLGNQDSVKLLANTVTASYIDILGSTVSLVSPPISNQTGNLSIDAAITAVASGVSGNTAAHTVTAFIDKPTGIEYVDNANAIYGGSDEENDETYRQRIRDVLSVNTGKVTSAGYRQTAESVEGVSRAQVIIPTGGAYRNVIQILITSSTGTGIPSPSLIAKVQQVVTADENRAVCDNITVIAPDVYTLNIGINILEYDTQYSQAVIESSITSAITSFLPTVEIGGKIYLVDLIDLVHNIAGVIDFAFTAPTGNITLGATEMVVAGTITINFA